MFCCGERRRQDKEFALPSAAAMKAIYEEWYDGRTMEPDKRNILYFFLLDMMGAVQKRWNKNRPGVFSKTVTVSDLAFGLYLLKHYNEIPPDEVLRKELNRQGNRKKRLDGDKKREALQEYGDWKKYFKRLHERPAEARGGAFPRVSMDYEIVAYVRELQIENSGSAQGQDDGGEAAQDAIVPVVDLMPANEYVGFDYDSIGEVVGLEWDNSPS